MLWNAWIMNNRWKILNSPMPLKHSLKLLVKKATQTLTKHGVDSPELNARMLLAYVLGIEEWQLSVYRQEITPEQTNKLESLIQQRSKRIPLQHLIGSVGFYGLEIEVSPSALIPRPETELLVETVLKTIQQKQAQHTPAKLLDLATGTGCIALALAKELPTAQVWGLDISQAALKLARMNAVHAGLENRVTWIESDLWKSIEDSKFQWDYIVSNPPYIPSYEIHELEPEVRDHDPMLALDGGEDGLDFYRTLAIQAAQWTSENGYIFLECGKDQAPAIKSLFKSASWFADQVVRDYNDIQRILVFRKGTNTDPHDQ